MGYFEEQFCYERWLRVAGLNTAAEGLLWKCGSSSRVILHQGRRMMSVDSQTLELLLKSLDSLRLPPLRAMSFETLANRVRDPQTSCAVFVSLDVELKGRVAESH